MKRALVFSGGGNRFFYAVGFYNYLVEVGLFHEHLKQYSYFAGSSAGALLSVFLNLYRTKGHIPFNTAINLKASDIYSFNPYRSVKIWEDNRIYYTTQRMRLATYIRLLAGKSALGETKSLHALLKGMFSFSDYIAFRNRDIDILVTATNYETGELVTCCLRDKEEGHKDYEEEDYLRFLDFVYASTCASPIIEGYSIDKRYYVDGGFTNNVPIVPLIKKYEEIDTIDVILLNGSISQKAKRPSNILESASRLFNVLLYNNLYDELDLANALAYIKGINRNKNITINVFRMGEEALDNVNLFLFDESVRDVLLRRGYEKGRLLGLEWHRSLCGGNIGILANRLTTTSTKINDTTMTVNYFNT